MIALPSIYALIPQEQGGRHARAGFTYQDHAGVNFLLTLIVSAKDQDIMFETEDDIVIVHKEQEPITVEFIQVKSNDLTSRWSVSQMLENEILQKSLKRGRCAENVVYRIITSYDVNSELEVLKTPFSDVPRDPHKVDALIASILSKKIEIPKNEKGHHIKDWVESCNWTKLPDTMESLKDKNLVFLEQILSDTRNLILPIDQKIELYQKLLALVQDASTNKTIPTFTKDTIERWMDKHLKEFATPKKGAEKMIEKLNAISLDDSFIKLAQDFRHKYHMESLNHSFVSKNAITKFKEEAQCLLQNLKLQLDTGDLNLSNLQFYSLCISKIEELAKLHKIETIIAHGCMYDITNRCTHRFLKVQA